MVVLETNGTSPKTETHSLTELILSPIDKRTIQLVTVDSFWVENLQTIYFQVSVDRVFKNSSHPKTMTTIHNTQFGTSIEKGKQYLLIAQERKGSDLVHGIFRELETYFDQSDYELLKSYYKLVENNHTGSVSLKSRNLTRAEGEMVEGKPHGKWVHYRERHFNPAFNIKSEENFNMGVYEGLQVKFSPLRNSSLHKQETFYEKGRIIKYVGYVRAKDSYHIQEQTDYEYHSDYVVKTMMSKGSKFEPPYEFVVLEPDFWYMNIRIFHGAHKVFNGKGQVIEEGTYWWGAKVGTWFYYKEDGSPDKKVKHPYPDRPQALFTCYYKHGAKQIQGAFENGKMEGEWVWFHENGLKKNKITFKNGMMDGRMQTFDEKESLIHEFYYVNGKEHGTSYSINTNDQIVTRGQAINGKREGKWTAHYPDGTLFQEYEYENGKLNNVSKEFHKNGKLARICEYQTGNRVNTYTEYLEDGRIKTTGQYDNGRRIGTWEYFYPQNNSSQTCDYGKKIDLNDPDFFNNSPKRCVVKDKDGNVTSETEY